MIKLFIFASLAACCAAQGLLAYDFLNLTIGVAYEKVDAFILNLNKDTTVAAQQTRLKSFVTNNVKNATVRTAELPKALKTVQVYGNLKKFIQSVFAAVDKAKILTAEKLTAVRKAFWTVDKELKHSMRLGFTYWMSDSKPLVPIAKWTLFNSTVTKAVLAYDAANPGKRGEFVLFFDRRTGLLNPSDNPNHRR